MKLTGLRKNAGRFVPALLLGIILLILWKSLALPQNTEAQDLPNFPFPEFSLLDLRTQEPIALDDLRGQVHIVHIWASWCGVCVREHDILMEIKDKFPFSMVGIIYRDSADKVRSILHSKGDPFDYLLNDNGGKLGLSLGLRGTPETYILDPEGVIRYHHVGAMTMQIFEHQFLPLLEKIKVE